MSRSKSDRLSANPRTSDVARTRAVCTSPSTSRESSPMHSPAPHSIVWVPSSHGRRPRREDQQAAPRLVGLDQHLPRGGVEVARALGEAPRARPRGGPRRSAPSGAGRSCPGRPSPQHCRIGPALSKIAADSLPRRRRRVILNHRRRVTAPGTGRRADSSGAGGAHAGRRDPGPQGGGRLHHRARRRPSPRPSSSSASAASARSSCRVTARRWPASSPSATSCADSPSSGPTSLEGRCRR